MIGTGSTAATEAYEQLRRHMLAGLPGGGRFGLAVLLREGVAAWIDRCAACPAPASSTSLNEAASLTVAPQLHAGIVQILASIALSMAQEINL
jgi:hypothetical protein